MSKKNYNSTTIANVAKHGYEATVKVRGVGERLTSSTTASTVDSVVMKGGRVISHVQYKATPRGIADTIRRVKDGQYRTATLRGMTETAKKFNAMAEKAGITKRMKDTGISGRTTKALGTACVARRLSPWPSAWAGRFPGSGAPSGIRFTESAESGQA